MTISMISFKKKPYILRSGFFGTIIKPNEGLIYLCLELIICLVVIAISYLNSASTQENLVFICRFGTITIIISGVLLAASRRTLFCPSILILASFACFLFGVPILIGTVPEYTSFYYKLVTLENVLVCSHFTLICIHLFVLGMLLASLKVGFIGKRKRKHTKVLAFLKNCSFVSRASITLMILFGFGAFYYELALLFGSISGGITYARSIAPSGAVVNLCRGLFIPFAILALIASEKRNMKTTILIVLVVYSIVATFSGDRTEGLTLIVVLMFYAYATAIDSRKVSGLQIGVFALILGLIVFCTIPIIAAIRMGSAIDVASLGSAITKAIEEMGFNFYTVCFQREIMGEFQRGLSYVAALFTIVPDSLQLGFVQDFVNANTPESLFNDAMRNSQDWVTFGLGYSLVAEAYLNFGFTGCLAFVPIGYLIQRLFDGSPIEYPEFSKYLCLVTMWSVITIPRRSIEYLINSASYHLLIVPIILAIVFFFSCKTNRKNYVF